MVFKDFRLILRDRIETGSILVEEGRIRILGPEDTYSEDEKIIDGESRHYLSPGFIDIHIHGAGGADVMDGTYESLDTISRTIAAHGTTSFLPTTMTQSPEDIKKAIQNIRMNRDRVTGAVIMGVHMEGPFVNPSDSTIGAQNPAHAVLPSLDTFNEITSDDPSLITTVTLAPELEGSRELIKYLRSEGINASMGHTGATYEEAMDGIEAGINHSTHIFNAMSGLHHRNPGTVGAILDSDITTETISDGIHVKWPALRLVYKAKGTDKVILVTDAMMACGMHDGLYSLGGQDVIKEGMEARLKNGALAGSVLTMDRAVQNVARNTSLPLYEVISMASSNPAVLCGVSEERGSIENGKYADLLILDENLQVRKVFIEGKEFHI